jgi:hypothetical protein
MPTPEEIALQRIRAAAELDLPRSAFCPIHHGRI